MAMVILSAVIHREADLSLRTVPNSAPQPGKTIEEAVEFTDALR